MNRYEPLIRDIYRKEGYRYAVSPASLEEQGFTCPARLASNENPFGPSVEAIKAVQAVLSDIHRYPDNETVSLISALQKYHGVSACVIGVGMDGVIETCLRAMISPGDRVVISMPTFSFYQLAATGLSAEVVRVLRKPDFSVDVHDFLNAARGAKISFLCTPNNPTGTVTPVETVREILDAIEGILFLDNAYCEFSDTDYTCLMNEYENLIIGRTFSKVYGLAGARVGYAFVPDWFVPFYTVAATPFALNNLSAAAAFGALSDSNHTEKTISHVKRWIRRFSDECRYPVLPSGANFVLVDTSPISGDICTDRLLKMGILVRSCSSFPGLADHYIRVSVGADWENEQFLEAVNTL